MIKCEIKFKLPSLNEYIDACRRNKYQGAKFKRETEDTIYPWIRWMKPFENPVKIYFEWHEKEYRRDPDNVAAGGRKFILDCLVKSGILKYDSRRYIVGWQDSFFYGSEQKVVLYFVEVKKDE